MKREETVYTQSDLDNRIISERAEAAHLATLDYERRSVGLWMPYMWERPADGIFVLVQRKYGLPEILKTPIEETANEILTWAIVK